MERRGGPRHRLCYWSARLVPDLFVLAADKDIEQTVVGLLTRHQSLQMREIEAEIRSFPGRDPGVFHHGPEFVAQLSNEFDHALLLLDCAWEGAPTPDPTALAGDIEGRLANHWDDRAAAIAIDPEIEVWVWSDSPHVAKSIDWPGNTAQLRQWLEEQGLWQPGDAKPPDPKEAFEQACRAVQLPASASVFNDLAMSVGLAKCTDPQFDRLRMILGSWFPA